MKTKSDVNSKRQSREPSATTAPLSIEQRSVAFCEWIEATFASLDSCDAADITHKAQKAFLPGPLDGKRQANITITHEQLLAALEGLEAVIEDTECLIESLKFPRLPLTGGEQQELALQTAKLRNFRRRQKELEAVSREMQARPKGDRPIIITHRQLTGALEAYDLAIESIDGLIDGIRDSSKNNADENRDLARHQNKLKKFQNRQKQLQELR